MYLIDTNVFLELLLKQEKAVSVEAFFKRIDSDKINLSDFSFYSIGIILFKSKKLNLFSSFTDDVVKNEVNIINYPYSKLNDLRIISERFSLDFDDAYQYVIAQKYNLTIVSFDKDFDKTDIKRKEPIELL